MNEITVTVPADVAIKAHIETIQAAQTKRNKRIAELEAEVRALKAGEIPSAELEAAEKRGYNRAYSEMQTAIYQAVKALGGTRTDIWRLFNEEPKEDS